MPGSQAWEPDLELGTLNLVEEPLQYNYFLACGSSTQWVWDLMYIVKVPSYHLVMPSLLLGVGYIYW